MTPEAEQYLRDAHERGRRHGAEQAVGLAIATWVVTTSLGLPGPHAWVLLVWFMYVTLA